MQPKTHIRAGTEEVVRRERRLWVCFLFCVLKDPKLFAMAVIGGGSKYLTGFKETDKDVLVKIVKLSQGRKTKGRKGAWKLASTGRGEILTMIPPSTLWMWLPPLCRRSLNPKTLMRSSCD